METVEKPSAKEIENSKIVLDMLSQIEGISFTQQSKEDLFVVNEEDTELSCVVDVEEDIVAVILKVSDTSDINPSQLLELNNKALYGAFAVEGDSLLFKNNLDIENLDVNELQSTLVSVFLNVSQYLESIESI